MKRVITELTAIVIDQAERLATEAACLPDGGSIAGAECVLHLRDAAAELNRAMDALRLAVASRATRRGA